MKKLILTFLICQISLVGFAKDNQVLQNLEIRQIESPIFFNDGTQDIVNKHLKNKPIVRKKYQATISAFNYDISKNETLKDVTTKGLTTSLRPFDLPEKTGHLTIGSSYYGSEHKAKNLQNNTYGLFSNYEIGKFSFQTKYARYTDRDFQNPDDKIYLTPRFELTRNLAIKVRHQKKVEDQNYKNDFILEYSLKNNPILKVDNMKLELNASYINNLDQEQQKQLGAKAKYYF